MNENLRASSKPLGARDVGQMSMFADLKNGVQQFDPAKSDDVDSGLPLVWLASAMLLVFMLVGSLPCGGTAGEGRCVRRRRRRSRGDVSIL